MIRRLLDILAASAGLLALSPILVLVALAVKLSSPGPVLYRSTRVGKAGKLFRMLKFRTMVAHADRLGPGITAGGDRRITSVGRFLRRTKLDELPQLINVVKGEMSLVGPRPEDPRYTALYTPEQRQVLKVRPGITSAASLAYRQEEQMLAGPDWERVYCTKVMPAKLEADLAYLSRRTFWSDVWLIIQTVLALFR
jgi:lipopolysaccharide/colanic/teichoic acid biosynthesis glycosyltransferase